MANKKLLQVLLHAGLTEKESAVYITVLALGPSTVLNISRYSKIKRTTVYAILELLKQKGLINIVIDGFKRLYFAESPEKISSILESRKKEFESSLPEFMALYNFKAGESSIKFYEGVEAVKTVYEGLLRNVQSGDDYLIFGDDTEWFNIDKEYFENFIERRSKLNIKIRTLLQDSSEARRHKMFEKNFNETIKILPKDTTLSTNLVITPQKVVIHQLTPPVSAIVIETKSIIQMHREMFEIVWKSI